MKPTDLNQCVKGGSDAVLTVLDLGVGLVTDHGRRLEVVGKVHLSLRAGCMVALVGESGCGKSITAAALGGLLPRGMVMDRGEIRWADGIPRGPGKGLAYVFQDPGECLDPVFTIGNQIREVLPPEDRDRAEARMEEILRTVGFEEPSRVLVSYPHQLSGGMQQRAMLAMALAGIGIAQLFEVLARPHIASGALVSVLDDWLPPFPGFHVYYPAREQMAPKLRVFVDFYKSTTPRPG